MDNIIFKKEHIELSFDIDSEIDLRREIDYYLDENDKIVIFDNKMWVLDDYTIKNIIIRVEKGRHEIFQSIEVFITMKYVSSDHILTSIPI